MNELIFSVAIITYNQEDYISQTLDGILSQEHNLAYEIVIGDDCSTDGTRSILEKYKQKYPGKIKLIFNDINLGIIGNYFNVLKKCCGKYLLQCAGDDYWLPGKITLQIESMENNPEYGMVYTKAKNYYQEKNRFSKNAWGGPSVKFNELIQGNTIPALSVAFRKELFNQYLDEVDPENKAWLMEDYPFWLWFSERSKILFIDKVTAVYRVLNDSASHINDFEKDVALASSFSDIAEYFCSLFQKEKLKQSIPNLRKYALLNLALKYNNTKNLKNIIYDLQITNRKYFIKKIIAKSFVLRKMYTYFYDYMYKR